MKNIFFVFAFGAITLSACNNSSNKNKQSDKISDSSTEHYVQKVSAFTSPVNGLLQIYLQMKNAFVNDNAMDAAKAGNEMKKALDDFEIDILRDEEKKTFEDITDDAKGHAEHIGLNAGNIEHQREHFDMLSKDMYDLVKKFTAGESIYINYCPMYNDNKGAIWLSESTEIKNPYYGNTMLTCGKTTETIQ